MSGNMRAPRSYEQLDRLENSRMKANQYRPSSPPRRRPSSPPRRKASSPNKVHSQAKVYRSNVNSSARGQSLRSPPRSSLRSPSSRSPPRMMSSERPSSPLRVPRIRSTANY